MATLTAPVICISIRILSSNTKRKGEFGDEEGERIMGLVRAKPESCPSTHGSQPVWIEMAGLVWKRPWEVREFAWFRVFPLGHCYVIFNSYLNIGFLKKAQFWHKWQLPILGSIATMLSSNLHFSKACGFSWKGRSAQQEISKHSTFSTQHSIEPSRAPGSL